MPAGNDDIEGFSQQRRIIIVHGIHGDAPALSARLPELTDLMMLMMCLGADTGSQLHAKPKHRSGSILSLRPSFTGRSDDTCRKMFNGGRGITPVAILSARTGRSTELDITVLQQDRVFNR